MRALDRSQRSIVLGSCAPWPIMWMSRPMHTSFPDKAITSEVRASDGELLSNLRERRYQFAVLHELPEARDVFCQRIGEENMTLSVKRGHRLADRESVTFDDLAGESILAWGNVSFWNEMLRARIGKTANLLFQNDFDALAEIITKTDFPNFSSDRMADAGYTGDGRIDIPIDEPDAHAIYYIACLDSEKKRYSSFFNTLRAQALARRQRFQALVPAGAWKRES